MNYAIKHEQAENSEGQEKKRVFDKIYLGWFSTQGYPNGSHMLEIHLLEPALEAPLLEYGTQRCNSRGAHLGGSGQAVPASPHTRICGPEGETPTASSFPMLCNPVAREAED